MGAPIDACKSSSFQLVWKYRNIYYSHKRQSMQELVKMIIPLWWSICLSVCVARGPYRREGEKFHSTPKTVNLSGVTIKVIPALHDNYMYMVIDERTKEAAVIDPVEPELILEDLKDKDYQLTKILTTHFHKDHAGGNQKLLEKFPELPVYGGDERVEALTTTVEEGDKLNIGSLKVTVIHTPCHTRGDICYLLKTPHDQPKALFTGDTLTIGGCGRFLEGSADQMYDNLYNKLGSLPNATMVFCGHEFTYANLMFATAVDPYNREVGRKLDWAEEMGNQRIPTVPSTIGEEWETNPFMRLETKDLQWRSESSDPVKTMAHIRAEKDNHKVI